MHVTMKKPRHKTPSSAKRARSASGADEGDRSAKGRWSSRRKTEIVLRIFRGETLDALSRELGVTPGKLAEGRDEALAGM
jgi:transposase